MLLRDHMCVIKYLCPDALAIVAIAVGETNGEMTDGRNRHGLSSVVASIDLAR